MKDQTNISPVTEDQRTQIIRATNDAIAKAEKIFHQSFSTLPIHFDLQGKSAGMYQVKGTNKRIRYNPWIFAKYYEESLSNTVVHEVAHYLVDCLWGINKVKPHGREWKNTMRLMGAEPVVRGDYDLTGIPRRQYRSFKYLCDCRSHELTIIRHRKIKEKKARYHCKICHGELKQASLDV